MTPSYSLRFETGERRGEVVPLTGSTFRIGRKAKNDLQIVENSVSGEHAELRLDDEGAVLVDLGSTNGTRVGTDRILEMRISPGAKLTLGNVEMTFESGTPASAPAVVPRDPAASVAPAQDPLAALEQTVEQSSGSLIEVSAEDLARARGGRGSRMGLLLVVALAVAGGGAWWWTQRGGGGSRRRARPVVQVAGNLLGADFSFEAGDDWSSAESATNSFRRSARSRFSGEMGLGVSLGPGEDAVHVSPWVTVRAGMRLVATCELRAPGAAQGLVGIELLPASAMDAEGEPQGMLGWSAPLSQEPAFQSVEVVAVVPPGYSRARVLVAGEAAGEAVAVSDDGDDGDDVDDVDDGDRSDGSDGSGTDSGADGGRVEFDDARLLAGGGGAPVARLEEYRLYPLGRAFSLLKVQRTLLDEMRLRSAGASARETEALTPSATGDGLILGLAGHLPATLFFRAQPEALASASGTGGLATMGAAGYSLRSEDFEDEAVTDLLLGSGVDLVRVSFGSPVRLRGRRVGGTFRFRVELPAGAEPLIQLRFQREREATVNLAADAEAAERRGDLGGCLSHWQKLLDEYPFEQREVARANAVRTRLLREGFDLIRDLSLKVEQAQFFRLINLYSEFRGKAQAIAERYAGSEVEQTARELLGRIEEQLRELESDRDEHEIGRLRSILAALEAQGAQQLASEVREYLATEYEIAASTNSSEGDR